MQHFEPNLLPLLDSKILFDCRSSELKPSRGEVIIDILEGVEDTKGNNGQTGKFIITNLRLIWYSSRSLSINLSIGFNCIQSSRIQIAQSKLRGATQALYVFGKHKESRFEFIFTHASTESLRLFEVVLSVIKAYQSTKLYREVKLRGSLMRGKELVLLPHESMIRVVSGVWNLANDQGHLGAFHLTNVRMVWQSLVNEFHNMSLPYLHVTEIEQIDSKYGKALVVVTSELSGGFTLGFRVDEESGGVNALMELLISTWRLYLDRPQFGIDVVSSKTEADHGQHVCFKFRAMISDSLIYFGQNIGPHAENATTTTSSTRVQVDHGHQQPWQAFQDNIQVVDEDRVYFQQQQHQQQQQMAFVHYALSTASKTTEDQDDGGGEECQDDIDYDPILGLAIEKLHEKEAVTSIVQLWTSLV